MPITSSYDPQEIGLVSSFELDTFFTSQSYVEYSIYDTNSNLYSIEYDFTEYSLISVDDIDFIGGFPSQQPNPEKSTKIEFFPSQSLVNNGFTQGEYIAYYNILNREIGSYLEQLYISEISSDRTEIRLDSNVLDQLQIVEQTNNFISKREESNYFVDFYLNLGENNLLLSNNIKLDDDQPDNPTILVKLYEPLLDEFDLNSTCWIVTSINEPISYNIIFEDPVFELNETSNIKGPNFNLPIKDQVNNSTQELNYNSLISTTLTSSQQQLNSLLEEKEIDVNIDYTTFDGYIHFSSAETRLRNFYYKIQLIEQYSSSIATLDNIVPSDISSSKALYQSKIDNIITNFDGYDYFLYYDNDAHAWPKTNSQKPYILAKSDSTTVLNWIGSTNESSPYYGGLLLSASLYDDQNKDNLLYTIPEYLRDDPNNTQYELFVQMVAQFYDNIWVYYKEVTKKYDNDNRLEFGVSKDIVADAIRDFGVKLYQNNFSNDDLYTALLGLTPQGGLFPFPNITGSLPTLTGYEYIENFISASNDFIPLDDVNKSIYKRIYHNLPYLLKAKGTIPGLKTLITSYGIPDTVLRINEYGGKDKINVNDWDHWQREFNYAFSTSGSNFISSSWGLNTAWNATDNVPGTLMFRFKTDGLPRTNIPYSQSLWYGDGDVALTLTYTGSAYTSGSYSGSIIDPYYQYATLTFYPDTNVPNETASVYLPFYDGGWWSVMVTKDSNTYNLYSQNKIYEGGENGTSLGFNASDSITYNSANWAGTSTSYFPVSFSVFDSAGYNVVSYDVGVYDGVGALVGTYTPFSGSYQEIRYYTVAISESVFKDYTMNPHSFEGNSLNSAPNELAFRASVGGELYLDRTSIHPKVTGSWATTHSFTSDSSFYYDASPYFVPNTEYFFADQPIAGIRNIIKDKIRVEDNIVPAGSTLSPFISVLQQSNISQSYTPNINYLEVAFSPQNEINEDIMDQIGFFNIGEYIGDPRLRSSSATSYPDLDNLRNDYFQKYTKNYNLTDFIRLIKFFDNSLFKMIKDFVPARTGLASGIVIKQHLLERNKYPQPQLTRENLELSGTLKPQWNGYNEGTVENFGGGTGGSLDKFNLLSNTSQSWNESVITPSGSVVVIRASQEEFYNGEFSGSIITATTQSLAAPYPNAVVLSSYSPILYSNNLNGLTNFDIDTTNQFIDPKTVPQVGEVLILAPYIVSQTFSGFPITASNTLSQTFFKVHKFDQLGNNNTTVLGNATKFRIESTSGGFKDYNIVQFNEFSDYYTFELAENSPDKISFNGSGIDTEIKDYYVSASRLNTPILQVTEPLVAASGGEQRVTAWQNVDGNIPHYGTPYFDPVEGYFTLGNTPNIPITINVTLRVDTLSTSTAASLGKIRLKRIRNGTVLNTYWQNTFPTPSSSTVNVSLTAAINDPGLDDYGLKDDIYYIELSGASGFGQSSRYQISGTSNKIIFSQSVDPITAFSSSVIVEPYITLANYDNSDFNPLFNNVDKLRDSSQYFDIDYSKGALEPVNFDTIISRTATRAKVQDSNYTTKRHIIPRYDGSRTTSQKLNKWTRGDTGTFGKLPTLESLKTNIAYCDWIGGWPPDKMNASAVHILYLIDEDGNVTTPNFSENSLKDVQGTFQTGERLSISSKTIGSGDPTEFRNIIRGGSRIEPILYTQIGKQPGALWTSSINLQDIVDGTGGATGNYQNNGGVFPQSTYTQTQRLKLNSNPLNSSYITDSTFNGFDYSRYIVQSGSINENVTLNFKLSNLLTQWENTTSTSTNINIGVILKKNNETIGLQQFPFSATSGGIRNAPIPLVEFSVPASILNENDEISFEIQADLISGNWSSSGVRIGDAFGIPGGNYSVIQIPIPTDPITVGTNNIWGYFDKTNYPYVITSSNAVSESLGALYGDPNAKQTDITDSGFNPIVLPWSIKYGDEFRFEGDERFTYIVGKVFGPNEGSGSRLSPTGSIEVQFDKNLPVSASTSVFNLDHFLIRRYVEDASQIIMEGFRPVNSQGPYLIKPEYVTDKLNKDIDDIILLLKEKGIITGDEGVQ